MIGYVENTVSLGLPRCVFVYGTLRRGERNHHFLKEAPLLSYHRTAPCYTLVNLGRYPAAIPGGETAIVGELYALGEGLLARLDRLEDCPREYIRELIPSPRGPAWMYVYRHPIPGALVIASGDWRLK
jgi:gamma-glutamylcyclotransferase (GGCT)/AIG2-like uncharacterized protein YtfP